MDSYIVELMDSARRQGRSLLSEPEGFEFLTHLGIRVPAFLAVGDPEEVTSSGLTELPGDRVVLKAISPDLAHKTEAGGVVVVPKSERQIRSAARRMRESLGNRELAGFLVQEFVPYVGDLGNELLLSLRWDREFGAVLTCGPGGLQAEIFARDLKAERSLAMMSPAQSERGIVERSLACLTVTRLLTMEQRGKPPRLPFGELVEAVEKFVTAASPWLDEHLDEIEINPLVPYGTGLIGLDVLVKLASPRSPLRSPRPLGKMKALLRPSSIAVIGASRRLNPGHMILRNTLRQGFDPERLYVVKPGLEILGGCRCVPDIASLPERVDILVIAVAANQVPEIVAAVVASQKAESLIVIPGGLDEKEGTGSLVDSVRRDLERSRQTDWGGPLLNGGNSMGIRSSPGHYDTFFLPDHKLPPAGEEDARCALVAQSGAFLAAKASKLADVAFKYSVSIGNQLDVTVGDYLHYLADDPELDLIAVYLEGFQDLDGLTSLEAVRRLADQGRTVVLYRAGRSEAGAHAAASHTASMAGSYEITVELARSAGALVADSLQDFEDLVRLVAALHRRPLAGMRLAALSNAGFECVALWDHLGAFEAASFTVQTEARLRQLFASARVDGVVDVHNPLDLTPMMNDEQFSQAVEVLLADHHVDVAVVGCVPLTGALNTLAESPHHSEDVLQSDAVVPRLVDLWRESEKPWVVVVDGGSAYDPMVEALQRGGVPTFRTADRAMSMLESYCRHRLGQG